MLKRYLIVGFAVGLLLFGISLSSARVSLASQSNPWKGQYFQNRTLSGAPSYTRDDPMISFEWGYDPPISGWTVRENYSARWTISDDFGSGVYTFAARSDDGVRMWVDGQLVIDEWHDQESGDWHSVDKTMTAGKHQVKVEYFQHNGWAAIYAGYYPIKPTKSATTKVTAGPSPTSAPSSTPQPTRTPSLFGTVSSSGSNPNPTAQVVPPAGFGGGGDGGAIGATASPNDQLIEFNVDKRAVWEGFPGPALHTGGQSGAYGYVKNRSVKPTFHIQWNIAVAQSGYYDLYVFVPAGQNMTRSASYRIYTNGTLTPAITIDQSSKPDQWVYLGSYYFLAGIEASQHVYLDNVTVEESGTRNIVLDAVRLVFKP